jgi:hypothetical protein
VLQASREVVENLLEIESTIDERAIPVALGYQKKHLLNARVAKGIACSFTRQCWDAPCHIVVCVHSSTWIMSWISDMCVLRVSAMQDPSMGLVWAGEPLQSCFRACM